MKKPVFFISSTIFDFKDLRSSIKWWLEENDYIVNASEFNDFDKPLDKNSYEACLKAIDNSDYFILLIGDRTGGMYDDQITITQMEYRHAYQRMLDGKIKIINFIRQDTLTNFINDKRKIQILNSSGEVAESIINKLFTREQKIRFSFIDEVRRVNEMKEGERPAGNWLHNFNTFQEINAVFRIELGGRFDLSFKQNRFVILSDLKSNLMMICSKHDGDIMTRGFMSTEQWGSFKLNMDLPTITLTQRQYVNYASFYVSCMQIRPLRANRIESFYKAGFFLEYDKSINDFVNGDLNQMASNLLGYYDRINTLHKGMYDGDNNKLIKLGKKNDNSHLKVTPVEIFFALEFYDTLKNCIHTSVNLYRALSGKAYSLPKPIHNERMPDEMRAKREDYPNEEDINNFINSYAGNFST